MSVLSLGADKGNMMCSQIMYSFLNCNKTKMSNKKCQNNLLNGVLLAKSKNENRFRCRNSGGPLLSRYTRFSNETVKIYLQNRFWFIATTPYKYALYCSSENCIVCDACFLCFASFYLWTTVLFLSFARTGFAWSHFFDFRAHNLVSCHHECFSTRFFESIRLQHIEQFMHMTLIILVACNTYTHTQFHTMCCV